MKPGLLVFLVLLISCSNSLPENIENSCAIFEEKSGWYDDSKKSYEKWGVPIHVQLAIIHQESRFRYDAKTEMDYFLWIMPVGRKSSAYGFAQVKDDTWKWYMEKTGSYGADRDDYDDAVDFIGWYGKQTYDSLKISKWDAYNQYLAYHEGHRGYRQKTFSKKTWLTNVARKVEKQAKKYHAQLLSCEDELNSGWWFW